MESRTASSRFRAVRRDLEASVLPLASSVDGRRFSFQASLHDLQLAARRLRRARRRQARPGAVARDGRARGRRPRSCRACRTEVTIRHARGEGVVSSRATARRSTTRRSGRPHRTRSARGSSARAPRAHGSTIGELSLAPGVPCALDAGGFDRHTFLCGQSGSGKTYSLGVILERLLIETSLRIVILDPNSDFVRLGHVRESSDGAAARPLPRGGRRRARAGAAAAAARSSSRSRRRRCCGSIRSPTARSTPSWPRCSAANEFDARQRPRRWPSAARNLGVGQARRVGPRRSDHRARRRAGRRRALRRRRPRLARHARGAVARRRRGARHAVGAARAARAGADRDRRGAQRLPGASRRTR